MERQVAAEWIEKLVSTMKEETSGKYPDPKYKDEIYEALNEAIKILKQGWIPVSERVPDYGDDVLCWTSYGHYKVCFRDYISEKMKGNAWTTATFKPVEVIAWMPLPERYKEGEKHV